MAVTGLTAASRSNRRYGIVRTVVTSKQTSQILEQIGMQSEVTIASDSSAARGICTRTVSIPLSVHSVVFNRACNARASVFVHIDEPLMMLQTSEMEDVMLSEDGVVFQQK